MPDGWVPWDNLWGLAVLRFAIQPGEAWRMTPQEAWRLVDLADGAKPGKAMTRDEFEEGRKRLGI